VILISNLTLSILEGSTIASTDIYGVKTYVNIGSGNVFNLSWTTPDELVDHYELVIKQHDTTLNEYFDIFNKNIGIVDSFFVNSDILPTVPRQYILSIYVVAYGKSGSVITSNVVNPHVSKGCGTYVKVTEGYAQPIMKRALAFAKVVQTFQPSQIAQNVLKDSDGKVLKDSQGRVLYTTGSSPTIESTLLDLKGRVLKDANDKVLLTTGSSVKTETTLLDLENRLLKDVQDRALLATEHSSSSAETELKLLDSNSRVLKDSLDRTLYSTEASSSTANQVLLLDSEGRELKDSDGKTLFAKTAATTVLESTTGWCLMQESYTKDTNGNWHVNDIRYEVLVDQDGYIITDENNDPIYIL